MEMFYASGISVRKIFGFLMLKGMGGPEENEGFRKADDIVAPDPSRKL